MRRAPTSRKPSPVVRDTKVFNRGLLREASSGIYLDPLTDLPPLREAWAPSAELRRRIRQVGQARDDDITVGSRGPGDQRIRYAFAQRIATYCPRTVLVEVGRIAAFDHLRYRTPDFDRFHSPLGLPRKSRLVQSCHGGSAERWYDSTMAADRRNRRRAEPVRRPDRRVLLASPILRGRTAGAGGVDPGDRRCPSTYRPGTPSCRRSIHEPPEPWRLAELHTDE